MLDSCKTHFIGEWLKTPPDRRRDLPVARPGDREVSATREGRARRARPYFAQKKGGSGLAEARGQPPASPLQRVLFYVVPGAGHLTAFARFAVSSGNRGDCDPGLDQRGTHRFLGGGVFANS